MAGLLYLALALFSAFGLVYVPSMIFVAGDAAATANNIVASESLFRLGFVSNLLAFTINIFVALLLYKLLKPAQPKYGLADGNTHSARACHCNAQ